MKKRMKILIVIVAIFGFFYLNNNWLQVSKYTVQSKKLPQSFDGMKIVQISDLHDSKFGKNHEDLIRKVQELKPDIIVITGDLIDSNNYKLQRSLAAVKGFVKIAPTYYVDGNHEIATNKVAEIQNAVSKLGVVVLNNDAVTLKRGNDSISIVGISDPLSGVKTKDMLAEALSKTSTQSFKILLAHRSEFASTYASNGIDVAFTGHAHGGQVRIPFVGGIINHQMQLFPRYLDGVEQTDGMSQVISRGLGNSLFPLRVFNRPEIVVATLKR